MKKSLILLIFVAFIFNISSFAQNDTLVFNDMGAGNFHKYWEKYTPSQNITSNAVLSQLYADSVLTPDDSLALISAKTTNNVSHNKFQQFHNGFPVEGAYFAFHSINGRLIAFNGTLVSGLSTYNTTTTISTAIAIDSAKAIIGATQYAWEDSAYLAILKDINDDVEFSIYPKPILTLYTSSLQNYVLAYKMEINSIAPHGRYDVFIDAVTGQVLNVLDNLQHASGSCATLHHGTQTLNFDNGATSGYDLRFNTKNIETFLFNDNEVDYTTQTYLPNSINTTWTGLSGNNIAALDVHWATEVVYDFFNALGINSFDGQGAQIKSYANFGNNSSTKNNAFWNGSFLTYGSGGGSTFPDPVVTLDVVGHEFGHALTEQFGGNLQYQGESGAINESISDMIAASIEHSILNSNSVYGGITPAPNEWILSQLNGGGIRDLSNPNLFGQPDTYNGSLWASTSGPDNGGVHSNSGVGNFWFYLLANIQGSAAIGPNPQNDNGTFYNVTSIGFVDALAVVLESYNYLTYNSDYLDFRNATIMAAQVLFNDWRVCEVINAWEAVGVGLPGEDCNIQAGIEYTQTQFCTNQAMSFSNMFGTSPGSSSLNFTWVLNGNTYTGYDLNINAPATAGVYTLTQVVTDIISGDFATDEIDLYINDCSPITTGNKGVWYFGYQNGFDFISGIAQPINYPYSNFESLTTFSLNGQLEYYISEETNSSGPSTMSLLNNSHSILSTLTPTVSASRQIGSSTIHPVAGAVRYANVFVDASSSGGSGLYQVLIDVSNPGSPVFVSKTPVMGPAGTSSDVNGAIKADDETVLVMPGCNEYIYWIMIRNGSEIKVFKLDYSPATGSLQGVLSYSSSYPFLSNPLKASPNGKYFASYNSLYSFNKTNGSITYFASLGNNYDNGVFSSNSRFYYTTSQTDNVVFQFDLLAANVQNSKTTIGQTPVRSGNTYLQNEFALGPDNKVYISSLGTNNNYNYTTQMNVREGIVSVINEPDVKEINGSVLFNGKAYFYDYAAEGGSKMCFPSFTDAKTKNEEPLTITYAQESCSTFHFVAPACKPYYTWDFGDGTVLNNSSQDEITHSFTGAGPYTVSLTSNINGTLTTVTEVINFGIDVSSIAISGAASTCEANSYFSGSSGFTGYDWSIIAGTATVNNSNAQQVTVTNTGGNYTIQLIVTDYNGCEATLTKTVSVFSPPVISVISTACVTSGLCDGQIIFDITSGLAPYTYLVNGSISGTTSNQVTLNGLCENNYSIVVTDANGCGTSINYNLGSIDVSAIITPLNWGVPLGSINITTTGGVAPYTYLWSNGAITEDLIDVIPGNYSVVITDNNGCSMTSNIFTIYNVGSQGIYELYPYNISCYGADDGYITAILHSYGGIEEYIWYDADGTLLNNTSNTISNLSAGTYYVFMFDQIIGYMASAIVIISEPTQIVISSINSTQNISCNGFNDGAATSSASGGTGTLTYSWSNGTNIVTGPTPTNLTAGSWMLTVTDVNNCSSQAGPIVITEPINSLAFSNLNTSVTCYSGNDASITFSNATGGVLPYQYSIDGGLSFSSNNVFNALSAGTYDLQVMDANGCQSNNTSITIINPAAITFNATPTNSTCFGANDGIINVTNIQNGVAPFMYSINGATAQTQNSFTGLQAGSYIIEVIDDNGCSSTINNVTITEPDALKLLLTNQPTISCYGNPDANIDVATIGGTAPYTYKWTVNGIIIATTEDLSNIGPDDYTLEVTDANGCINSLQVTINNLTSPIANAIEIGTGPYSITYLSQLISNNVMPSNVISNTTLIVNGILVIDFTGYSMQNCKFYFAPGAGLDIKTASNPPQYNVFAVNTTFDALNDCNIMWRGIKMHPETGALFRQCKVNNAHYAIEAQKSCLLRLQKTIFTNDYIGVYIPSSQYSVNTNTRLLEFQVSRCRFESEGAGLLKTYQGQVGDNNFDIPTPTIGSRGLAGIWSVNNTFFNIQGNHTEFKALFYGIGIKTTNYQDFMSIVQDCDFFEIQANIPGMSNPTLLGRSTGVLYNYAYNVTNYSYVESCYFDNVYNGINAKNSNLSIRNNTINHVFGVGINHNSSPNNASSILNNTITCIKSGIRAFGPFSSIDYQGNTINVLNSALNVISAQAIFVTNNTTPSSIRYNIINLEKAEAGINLLTVDKMEVVSNTINMLPNANGNALASKGIKIEGGSGNVMAKNNILFTGIQTATQLGNNSNEPVAIDLVSSTNATLQCNTMDKTYTGIRLAGTVGGLDISGNTFGKHFTGLRYTGSMSQNGTNNIAQDNRGNIWSTNPNDYGLTSNNGGGAYNQGYASTTNQFFLQAQIFNVPQNTLYQPPTYYPKPSPSFPNLPDWFPAVISGTALFQCDQSVFFKPAPPSSPNVNSMVQTAQGIIPLSVFQTELNKQEQRLMYTEMKENMSLLSLSTVVDSFYIESESNELKEMYDAKSLKKEIEAQAPNEKLTVENTKNQRMSVMNELLVLDSLHKNDSLSLDTSYIEVRDSLLEYLMAKSEIIKTEKATIKIAEVLKTDESIIKYNTIYTQETIDYNTKYTNSLWMQVLHKNHTVSTAETNVLYSIADQCPLAGGGGVYAARSLLLMQQDTFWIDYDRCAQAGYQINKKDDEDIADIAKESLQIKIYPNPVSKKLYIQLNIPKDLALKQVWIKITSMEGKTVYKHTVEISDSKELIIDIAALELSSGVYSISLYHQKEEIHYEKLLIE